MKYFLLSLFLSNCFWASGQELNCNQFKTGKFKMEDPNTGVNYISRNDSIQIEYLPKFEIKVELNVKWINNCTLELSLKNVLENPNNIDIQDFILISEIIETGKNYYVMKSKAEGIEIELTQKYFLDN